MEDDRIVMVMEDGSEAEFSVLASAAVNGLSYILVTDALEDEDGECYLLRDISDPESDEAMYETVLDDEELDRVIPVFREQLKEDIDIE